MPGRRPSQAEALGAASRATRTHSQLSWEKSLTLPQPSPTRSMGALADTQQDGEISGMEQSACRSGQGHGEVCDRSLPGHSDWGVPPATLTPESSPARDAAVGAALAVGGLAVGTGLRTAGFVASGHMIQRCALLQLAGQATSALQVEEVRDNLAACAGHARKAARKVTRRASSSAEWMNCPPPPCLPGASDTDSDAEAEPSHAAGEQWPWCGAWVRLTGLAQASHFNGRVGEIVGTDNVTGRAIVQLLPPLVPLHAPAADSKGPAMGGSGSTSAAQHAAKKVKVKVENLEPAVEQSALPPRGALQFI